jgi:hypothetical protein
MPILGIVASGKTASTISTSSYESIATVTVGSGGQNGVTFSSIPSTYKHLQIRYTARTSGSQNTVLTFNGDGASNYSTHFVFGQGSIMGTGAIANNTYIYTDVLTGSSTGYNGVIVDILDYTSTTKHKTVKSFSGQDLNGTAAYVWLASGAWYNSSTAISSLTLNCGTTYNQYSSFALYGIKG